MFSLFDCVGKARRRRGLLAGSVSAVSVVENMEPRQLLSADVKLETMLHGSGIVIAKAEYELDDGEHELEVEIFNAPSGSYSVEVDGRQIGNVFVSAWGHGETKFGRNNQKADIELPADLTLPLTPGQKIRVVSAAGVEIAGNLASEADDRFETALRVYAVGDTGQVLESEFEAEQEDQVVERKFVLKVYNLSPSTSFNFSLAGWTGQLTTDQTGSAAVRYSDRARNRFSAFPADFPALKVNDTVSVGTVVSGTYTGALQTAEDDITDGLQSRVRLIGDGPLQGIVYWDSSIGTGGDSSIREFKVEVWGGNAGAQYSVTIHPGGSNAVPVGPVTLDNRGFGRLKFETDDPQKSFPTNFPAISINTVFTVGESLSGVYTGVKQVAEPQTRSTKLAYELEQEHEFHPAGSFFENWGDRGEKWFLSSDDRWHFITPDGSVYEWDETAGANGKRLEILDDSYHNRPELLLEAKAGGGSDDQNTLAEALAAKLDRDLRLESYPSFDDWGGRRERWFRGNDKWYFLTTDGVLTRWNGQRNIGGVEIGQLDNRYHESPEKLSTAADSLSENERRFAFKKSLLAENYRSDLNNWENIDVKWIKSSDDKWYFVRSDDSVYRWDGHAPKESGGKKDVGGELITKIEDCYEQPELLTSLPDDLPGTVPSRRILDYFFSDIFDID